MQGNPEQEAKDALTRKYQRALYDLANQYHTRSDFTVELQPCSENLVVPYLDGGKKPDLSFMAPDCFHLSQKGHATAAVGLWNNMLQPAGQKQTSLDPNKIKLVCPEKTCPYLRTSVNSANC